MFFAFLIFQGLVFADHRAALVIANHNYAAAELKLEAPDLKAVVARLERHGFQCTVKSNLDNNELKRTIEGFAARTPVRGTGLVYFTGELLRRNRAVKRCACWIPTKPPGIGVDYVFSQLHAKGGSTRQLVVVDAPKVAAQSMELPGDVCLPSVTGKRFLRHWASVPSHRRATSWGRSRQAGDEWVGPRDGHCWCPPGRFVMGSPENKPAGTPMKLSVSWSWPTGFGWLSTNGRARYGEVVGIVRQ